MKLFRINKQKQDNTSIADIIKKLMHVAGISESVLARETNIPQTTLNRLLTKGLDARTKTLRPIGNFFNVSVSQLIGEAPIDYSSIEFDAGLNDNECWNNIPVIRWEDISFWEFIKKSIDPYTNRHILTEKSVSRNTFACVIERQFEPLFHKGSTLIIDADKKIDDNSLVIIRELNKEPVMRKIVLGEDNEILVTHPIITSTIPEPMGRNTKIVGVILECRLSVL